MSMKRFSQRMWSEAKKSSKKEKKRTEKDILGLYQNMPFIDWDIQLFKDPQKQEALCSVSNPCRRSHSWSRSRSRSSSRKRDKKSVDVDLDYVIGALHGMETHEMECPDTRASKESHLPESIDSGSLDHTPELDLDNLHIVHGNLRRMNSDGNIEQIRIDGGGGKRAMGGNMQQHMKRISRASDTSSAYSGSDVMQSSLDDPDNPEEELNGLVETGVDSDDEEGYADSTESFPIRDAVRDCLEKDPSERVEDDIEILMDFMQHYQAFANMTHMTRHALCSVMIFGIVPCEGTIVLKDGDELDSWYVILNGEVEVTRLDGSRELMQMGDSFGITPVMQKLYQKGMMKTLTDDFQFVCISQQDYYRILHQGEENIRRHEEQGKVVMVTEHRELDGGNRRGHIVIRGTTERLMQHLVEDHSTIDPTYVEDFLLCYRTFMPNPIDLANRLLQWFDNPAYRTKVARVVLYWVNNHFNDFETDPAMCEFLENFESMLEKELMMGEMSLLNMACAAKAKVRIVTLTRTSRDEALPFSIQGGQEKGCGIFITKVEKDSRAAELGLKRGDQILEVNGQKFHEIIFNKAIEILKSSTHLSISVKSNLQDFKQMLRKMEKTTPKKNKREENQMGCRSRCRLSVPDLDMDGTLNHISTKADKKSSRKGLFGLTAKPRLRRAFEKMNIFPMFIGSSINNSDENLYAKSSRKTSVFSYFSSMARSKHLSASNPDLSVHSSGVDDRSDIPDHVIKVYRADQSFKFLLIHKETTAGEVVTEALQEFGVTEPNADYCLCEVTVESEKFIKRRRLADQLVNLPERLNQNGRRAVPRVHRFYLKNNLSTEPLIPDEMIGELLKESEIMLLQLNAAEVAWQLTLDDFRAFREIEPTEYIDELFKLNSKYGCPMICKFAELVNREMFWVVTEICGESSIVRRMKLIKLFIKIAKCCKDYRNFNSMFAILSGLGHHSVMRLHSTWDRVPSKYLKLYEDLQTLMNVSRNMAKYRNMLNSEHVQPPIIPVFPVVKKDLTSIYLGNDSKVDGLINFEKLRMMAKELRNIANMCSVKYDVNSFFLSSQNDFASSLVSGMATVRRIKNRRGSVLPNPKKMYEEAQMVRRVRSYLSTMPANTNEDKLAEMSNQCEAPARKREVSPGVSNSPNLEEKRLTSAGPRFGAQSPGAVRKIMALTDKVRPHNPKIPVPTTSPKGGKHGPPSPHQALWSGLPLVHSTLLPVKLTHESSSVSSLIKTPPNSPIRAGSVGSMEMCADLTSPNHSVKRQNRYPVRSLSGPSEASLQCSANSQQESGLTGIQDEEEEEEEEEAQVSAV